MANRTPFGCATAAYLPLAHRVRGAAGIHSIFDGLVDEVRISSVIRYDGDFEIQQEGFEPDADTTALYHFDEEVGGTIKDFSKNGVDGKLVGKAELVPSDAPTTLSVGARGKLATVWGKIKRQ